LYSFSKAGGDCSLLAPNPPGPFDVGDGFLPLCSSCKESNREDGSGGGAKVCPPPKVGYTETGRNPNGVSNSVLMADPGLGGGGSRGVWGSSADRERKYPGRLWLNEAAIVSGGSRLMRLPP
jgi:hypothetical protein